MENMDVLFQRQWERVDANVRDFLSSQLIISLDMVQHPYYGNVEKAQVVGGKRKKSASRHHTYGSAKLLWEGHGLTVAVRMLHKGQERYAWAKEILAQAARYGRPLLFLADGGFWIKELLWDWAQGGYAFIVHVGSGVTGTEIPKNLQREAELTGEIETTKYTILLDKPKRELTVRLIAWSEKNGKNRCIGVPSYLDDLPVGSVRQFEGELLDYVENEFPDVTHDIRKARDLSDENEEQLKKAIVSYVEKFKEKLSSEKGTQASAVSA